MDKKERASTAIGPGSQVGHLTVSAATDKRKNGYTVWLCRCDCGKECCATSTQLAQGYKKSCGCLRSAVCKENLKLLDGTSVTVLESKKQPARNCASGHTGVYFKKETGKWVAQIRFKGEAFHLGSFDTFEEAVKARERGEEKHGDFLEWYYSIYPQK